MKYSKLSFAVLLGLGIAACGGGGGGSGGGSDSNNNNSTTDTPSTVETTIVKQQVNYATYASGASTQADASSVICLDVNGNEVCDNEEPNQEAKGDEGTVTLQWEKEKVTVTVSNDTNIIFTKDSNVILSTKALNGNYGNKPLYLHPLQNVVENYKGNNGTSEVFGDDYEKLSQFNATKPFPKDDSILVVAHTLAKLGYSTEPVDLKDKLVSALSVISAALERTPQDEATESIDKFSDILANNKDGKSELEKYHQDINNKTPEAAFTYSADKGTVTFTNISKDAENDKLTYKWDFGDGKTSTEVSPKHTYAANGSYNVSLEANDGNSYTKFTKNVSVTGINSAPVASFEVVSNSNLKVVFNNNSTDADNDKLTYTWNFGDGKTSTEKAPTHEYAKAGTYTVILVVSDGKVSNPTTKKFTVSASAATNNAPVAQFTYSQVKNSYDIEFTNTSTDADNDKLTYSWTINGQKLTTKDPVVSFAGAGKYDVSLTVSDGNTPSNTKQTIVVNEITGSNTAPVAKFSYKQAQDSLKVTFVNESKDADNDKLSYVWDVDGFEKTEDSFDFTFDKAGTYKVTLTVSDGKESTLYESNVVVNPVIDTPSTNHAPVAKFTQSVNKLTVKFTNKSTDADNDTLTYAWDFGDGKTSTEKSPSHTYAKDGSYTVKLTVSDKKETNVKTTTVKVTDDVVVIDCTTDKPTCLGSYPISNCTKEECKDVDKKVCSKVGGNGLDSIETTYYSTNPNGQVGKNKTITSMSDWTTDMIVAQGAANDDPRAFRGYHEKATDFYALYAAWDDTNLYLMVEMPNLDGAETCGDFDYSCDQFLPMGIGIRTGKRVAGSGIMAEGNNPWGTSQFWSIKDGIDTLLFFHPRVPTVNTPGLFKTDANGYFSYDSKSGYLLGFPEAGIERVVEQGTISKNYYGISDNYGGTAEDYKNESKYVDLLATKEKASGHLYQVTIPLASIDLTKSDIETNGIGVVAFSTFGESMMDALPWSPVLVDKAADAYSKDDSTSAEKEDVDEYDVALASVGVVQGGGETVCETQTVQQCTNVQLSESECGDTPELKLSIIDHEEVSAKGKVTSTFSWMTGYDNISYEITTSENASSKTTERSKSISFKKGDAEKVVTVTVKGTAPSGKTAQASFDITVPACAEGECGIIPPSNDLISVVDGKSDHIFVDDGETTCKLPTGAIALKADVTSAPNVYAYNDKTTYSAKWPGDTMTKLDGCTSTFWTYTPSNADALLIFSGVGSERYPADMQPGESFNLDTPCFDWDSKKFVSADACGLAAAALTDSVYVYRSGSKVVSGSTITITAKDGDAKSQYVDLELLMSGKGVNATTRGTYTINNSEEYEFENGDIIRVAEKLDAADTAAGETPSEVVITVKYNDAVAKYTIKKVKWQEPVAKNDFSWNNALVYFVMTDRFENGDTSNDNSYGRPKKDTSGHATATFHGGDIKGLTSRLDYIKSLGMNAIWLTAPYEQAHGWTGGGSSGAFAHYAYHGYYALDFTSLDANMGTVEEFRTFVNEAHKRGIRVVLDIVMNHTGYATLKDMCDYGFGATTNGWDACQDWTPSNGSTYHNKPIDESTNSKWDSWWGKNWIIFGGYGEQCGAGDGLNACVSYLPDFKNSETNGSAVSVPTFLSQKWATGDAAHDVPAAKQYRTGNMSVAQFQAHWLASWVEEFGIDGFRCDTAKHVTKSTWKLLKEYSQEALKKWRANNSSDVAASWTDDFWMTGEHWGLKTGDIYTDKDGYGSQGGFDSMINFAFNGQANGSCSAPSVSIWDSYAGMYGVGSGSPKLNALTYVSSHDTSLCRPSDMKGLGTALVLLPGGVSVYYGDETARQNDHGGSGNDAEHGTRSDMNFPSDISSQAQWAANVDTLSTTFSSNATLAHWQKVGQFRFRNVAVGAGKQTKTSDGSYCRIYNDEATGINNAVVIHVGSASTVAVGDCFADGTEVQDGYSGATGTVSGGSVSLSGTGELVLLELKR